MNKYYTLLAKILKVGKDQTNKKGGIRYLLNENLALTPGDLLAIFEEHPIARKKLKAELNLFMDGITDIEPYNAQNIVWWDYCKPFLLNSYPTYMVHLPELIGKIRQEKRPSKNYILFLGANGLETNQLPCISTIQFQLENEDDGTLSLVVSAYQRSSDANLGLPSDLYQLYLISNLIGIPLKSINLFLANVHIYHSNLAETERLLNTQNHECAADILRPSDFHFTLNV